MVGSDRSSNGDGFPVFGQIKQGLPAFLLRGTVVNGEWSLICTGHNLLKLFRDLPDKARVNRSVSLIEIRV